MNFVKVPIHVSKAVLQYIALTDWQVNKWPCRSSSDEISPHQLDGHVSSDDDDLMDLETLSMMEGQYEKITRCTFPLSGKAYTAFVLNSNPRIIKDILHVNKHTFRALVLELVEIGQLEWDHKHISVEESLAIFLYICEQSTVWSILDTPIWQGISRTTIS